MGTRDFALWCLVVSAMAAEGQAQNRGVLRGRVLADSTNAPIPGATIATIFDGLAATTDSLGYFRLGALSPQVHRFFVRRLGFAPATTSLSFLRGDSIEVDFVLSQLPEMLPEVVIAGSGVPRRLRDFHDRRRFGMGTFFDSTDISRMTLMQLTDVARRLPGVFHSCPRGECGFYTMRRGPIRPNMYCPVGLGVDGMLFTGFPVNMIQPHEVAAVEYHRGGATIPAEFNRTGNSCGLIMIWTK